MNTSVRDNTELGRLATETRAAPLACGAIRPNASNSD